MILRRRGLTHYHVPPISLVMATEVDRYVKALTAYRGDDEVEWTVYFAQTAVAASRAAEDLGECLTALQAEWLEKAGARRGSTAEKIIEALPSQPVIDVRAAAKLSGTSEEAARQALNALEERGVLKQVTKHNRGRVWEARGLWNLLDRFEQRLATPDGQDRTARPAPRTR